MTGSRGKLQLNPGAQEAFVRGDEKFSAYIGGLGSGKTWAGIARGLKFALQPKPEGVFHAPHGIICGATYGALRDTIIPKLQEVMHITGLADWDKDYKKAAGVMELTLKNGAIIRLRSLDKPDTIARGPEYTWAFIDEGRNISYYGWKLVTGRLRQPGYKRGAWVASTPNGFDWMYHVFHPDGDHHEEEYADANWYNAPMRENIHLDADYLDMMDRSYSGRFHEQEVEGKFVGIVEGGVFSSWDPREFTYPIAYRPELPLYSFWDFGIGDPGVCIFAQVEWKPVDMGPGVRPMKLPWLYILHSIEAKDWTAAMWADAYHAALNQEFPLGTRTKANYGDPAGLNRAPGSGTSVISDLSAAGVDIIAASKKPQDFAIRILQNMMEDRRVLVNVDGAKRVSDAFSSHKWKLDKDGVRVGENPVHDWTSHLVDAVRYGATMLLPFHPRDIDDLEQPEPYAPNTYGYVFDQLMNQPKDQWIGVRGRKRPSFVPIVQSQES